MKYTFLWIMLIGILSTSHSQTSDTIHVDSSTVYIKFPNGTVSVFHQKDSTSCHGKRAHTFYFPSARNNQNIRTRWLLMDLGTDILVTDRTYTLDNGIDPFEINAWKSTNVNLTLFNQRINIIDHKFNFQWGMSFEFHKYYFTNPVTFAAKTPQVQIDYHDNIDFDKNRLSYSYFTVPLMLNFESNPSNPSKSFRLSAGVFGGPRLGANFKTKTDGEKDKVRDDFNLAPFRYGIRGEIGFGVFNFYGTMALNELFEEEKNNGYVITPMSIGVQIIPF